MPTDSAKAAVRDFWDEAACGERPYLPEVSAEAFRSHAQARYDIEPFIRPFARFNESHGLRVLEVGVGLGADHQCFAEQGAQLSGVDLTPRAIEMTRRRLDALGLASDLRVGDAEHLDYPDNTFDVVYSWGVIHHSPDTAQAVPGQRHRGPLLTVARVIWPRWFLRTFCKGLGLFMLIEATKPR